jgi:HD-GYP domain-containing protein (c-di-GMP phosphodiesterase class II)
MQRAITFLCEDASLPSNVATSDTVGGSLLQLSGTSRVEPDCHVVVMADLGEVAVVKLLRNALSGHRVGCRLFMVDKSSRVSQVHADVLGADHQLKGPDTAKEIAAVIRAYERERGSERTVEEAIDAGLRVLATTFQGLLQNTQLDEPTLLRSTEQIVDAIDYAGTERWLELIRRHHSGTFQHCMLVTGVATSFGAGTGMRRDDVAKLTTAALLHDIGKATVPAMILDKPTALTPEETAVLRTHPRVAFDYLSSNSRIDAQIMGSVLHHHEYLDGSGYPDRLSGSQIDDITRIITICDIYAALVERRTYKAPMASGAAIDVLVGMGMQGKVEPALVQALKSVLNQR